MPNRAYGIRHRIKLVSDRQGTVAERDARSACLFEQTLRIHKFRVKLDGGHALDPVDAGVAGHVAREAEWERGGLFPMLVRNCISMLGVPHRGQKILVISDTTRDSLISRAERRTSSSYDINALTHCISPKPVAKYRRSLRAAHRANSGVTTRGQTEENESESARTFWDHCDGSTPPTPPCAT